MISKTYTDILIEGDKFSIIEKSLSRKERQEACPDFALTTLKRIEEVIRRELKYSGDNAIYSKMTDNQMRLALQTKAEDIRNRYLAKSHSICWIRRFFGGVERKEQAIDSLYRDIQQLTRQLTRPGPITTLPEDMTKHLSRFLSVRDLGNLAPTNQQFANQIYREEKSLIVLRAREYGYPGHGRNEAKLYLKSIFWPVSRLAKDGYIPQSLIIWRQNGDGNFDVDVEATFKHIRELQKEKKHGVKEFQNGLLKYIAEEQVLEIEVFLKMGVNVNFNSPGSPLHEAICTENYEIIKALLKYGADPNIRDLQNLTPLMQAAIMGDRKIVQLLLKHKARVNDTKKDGKNTALCLALRTEKSEAEMTPIVKALLDVGADVNVPDENGLSPLHWAAEECFGGIVNLLLKHGAHVNDLGDGRTALFFTVASKKSETEIKPIAQALLDAGADPNIATHTYHNTPLHWAANCCLLEIVNLLIQHKADINAQETQGRTALYCSLGLIKSESEQKPIIQALLKAGADPNIARNDHSTPLHRAVEIGFFEIAKLLVQHGAQVNGTGREGSTALLLAMCVKKPEAEITKMVKFLLEAGADPNIANECQDTPLHWAASKGYYTTVILLLRYRAEIDRLECDSYTALAIASREGREKVVELLLARGANRDLLNNEGKTAEQLAKTDSIKSLFGSM